MRSSVNKQKVHVLSISRRNEAGLQALGKDSCVEHTVARTQPEPSLGQAPLIPNCEGLSQSNIQILDPFHSKAPKPNSS